ncbi:hypothetical protein, partial [Streptomyces plumbiresistens]|uniref:hypothetical protein n=1 Tax=Streptomyces plumbiresistens TaxID=511811 RepID=UPI0031ED7681
LGSDAVELVESFDTALWALDRMRSGEWKLDGDRDEDTLAEIQTAIRAVVHRLAPRIEATAKALLGQHVEAGGSYGELAQAMDTARSTAQSRAQKIIGNPPDDWEDWATGDGHRKGATEELDTSLPAGLILRWGQPAVREIMAPSPVWIRDDQGELDREEWNPRTAVAHWIPNLEVGDPHKTPILFRTADDLWVLRADWSKEYNVRPGMRFFYATKGEALRFLEEGGYFVDIARYFPEMVN